MASKKARAGIRSFQVTDKRAGGTASFDVGGTATVELSGEVRETLESANNAAPGFKVMQNRGRIEAEVIDSGDVSMSAMMGWSEVTAILTTVSGKTYAVDGWLTDKPSLNIIEGTLTIAIEGIVTEQVFG
jgi:hypothetical protein